MAVKTTDNLKSTLRGKIWLSMTGLAVVISCVGLAAYLVANSFNADLLVIIFLPFLIASFLVVIFGWWLSNEVLKPIERLTLLSKAMERSSSASLPKTTGAAEIDELLFTLHRNSQQIQSIVSSMDDVVSGKVVSELPQGTDRLSATFQKLVNRVNESVNAKAELDELRSALTRLKNDLSRVNQGNLDVSLEGNNSDTRELIEACRAVVQRLKTVSGAMIRNGGDAQNSSAEVRRLLVDALAADDAFNKMLSGAVTEFKDSPKFISNVMSGLMESLSNLDKTSEAVKSGRSFTRQTSASMENIRKQMNETSKKISRLNDRASAISRSIRVAEDMARRSEMVAINISINTGEREDSTSYKLLADEVQLIATRSESIRKEMSIIYDTVNREIREIEESLNTTVKQVGSLSKEALDSSESLGYIEQFVEQIGHLRGDIDNFAAEQIIRDEATAEIYRLAVSGTKESADKLREAEIVVQGFAKSAETMLQTVSDLAQPSFRELPQTPVLKTEELIDLENLLVPAGKN